MHRLFFRSLIAFCLLSFGLSTLCEAQYLERKKKYGHIEYAYQAGDPHKRWVAVLGHAVLPGTGHLLAGAPKRALGFAAGFYGSTLIGAYGLSNMAKDNTLLQDGNNNQGANRMLFGLGLAGAAVFYVYGLFDVMEVAEINNLAYRDRQKGFSWQLSPDLNSFTAQPQLSLRLKYALGN